MASENTFALPIEFALDHSTQALFSYCSEAELGLSRPDHLRRGLPTTLFRERGSPVDQGFGEHEVAVDCCADISVVGAVEATSRR